jgi:hypothetical protein
MFVYLLPYYSYAHLYMHFIKKCEKDTMRNFSLNEHTDLHFLSLSFIDLITMTFD